MQSGRKIKRHFRLNILTAPLSVLYVSNVTLLKQIDMDKFFFFKKWQGAWMLFAVVLFLFSTLQVSAQRAENLNVILSGQSDENQELNSLFSDVHPSVYAENGELKVYGDTAPVVAFATPESFSMLASGSESFSSVKLLRITVSQPEQLSLNLNLGQLESFEALEYVVVVFAYDACGSSSENCLPGLTQNLVASTEELPVYYLLSIPN